jgi:hypothetical protein
MGRCGRSLERVHSLELEGKPAVRGLLLDGDGVWVYAGKELVRWILVALG